MVKQLADRKVLSAPVLDDKSGALLGFVDVLDVVSQVTKSAPEPRDIAADNLKALEMSGRAMALQSVDRVVNASGRDAAVEISPEAPLSEPVVLFSKGVHRVAVTRDMKIEGIVSQSNLVAWLCPLLKEGKLKAMGSQTLDKLSLVTDAVVAAALDDPVLKLLRIVEKSGSGSVVRLRTE